MKRILNHTMLAVAGAIALFATVSLRAEDEKARCEQAITSFKLADSGLTNFFDRAAGYALFPSVGEGGLIIAAERGKGLLYEKGQVTGKVTLTEVSIGAQAGGGAFSEVIFFETAEALKEFKKSKYEMGAAVKASVAASGASANAKYQQGVAVFTLPKSGAIVSAAIGGQKFKFEPTR